MYNIQHVIFNGEIWSDSLLEVPFKNQTNGCGCCLQIKIRRFGDNCAKCLTFIGYSRNF